MKKNFVLISILLIALSFVFISCTQQNSPKKDENNIDLNQFIDIRISEGFKEVKVKQELYGVEFKLTNCQINDLQIDRAFYLTKETDSGVVLTIASSKKMTNGMILFRAPVKTEVKILDIVNELPSDNGQSKSRDGIPVLLGDFNHDSYVDIYDFMLFKEKYRLKPEDQDYSQEYDIYPAVKTFTEPEWADIFSENSPDGIINLYDFIYFTFNYRKSVNRSPILEWVKPNNVNTTGEATISWSAVDYDKNDIEFQIKIFEEDVLEKTVQLTNSTETTYTFVEGNSYRFELTATDVVNANATAESTEMNKVFVVNKAPTVTKITEDVQNIYVSSTIFEWEGNDEDGTIDHYEYKIDDGSWITITENQIELSDYDEGEHTIFVKAVDNDRAYSESIAWTFEYIAHVLMLDYLSGKIYVKAYGLRDVKGIMFEMNYDSDKVTMGNASTEEEGGDGELFFSDSSNGTYTMDIGFWSTKDTIDGTIASIDVVNVVGSSSVNFKDATIVNVIGENEIGNNDIEYFGDTIRKESSIKQVLVHAGTFQMGNTRNDSEGEDWETPVHTVTLTYDFYIGQYEVTFDEYGTYCEAIGIGKPDDGVWGMGRRPVINVNWWNAIHYCNWLSEQEGYKPAYDNSGNLLDINGQVTKDITKVEGYRLPTEAEWEYAARGGHEDITDGVEANDYKHAGRYPINWVVWYNENSNYKTHEVGNKYPNELGLYDMNGNVWEWCHDYWNSNYYDRGSRQNPVNLNNSSSRVWRGGSWYDYEMLCRVASRSFYSPIGKSSALGFRIAKTHD